MSDRRDATPGITPLRRRVPPTLPQGLDRFDKTAVITIQGSALNGLCLLGQLDALLQDDVIPLALAGTSAGAVVATLFWVGYEPIEILDLFADLAPERATYGAAPPPSRLLELFGPFDDSPDVHQVWKLGKSFVKAWKGRRIGPTPSVVRIRKPSREILARRYARFIRTAPRHFRHWFTRGTGLDHVASQRKGIKALVNSLGIFRFERIETILDQWLRDSPRLRRFRDDLPKDRPLTFADIHDLWDASRNAPEAYFRPLILTTTDLTRRELILIKSYDMKNFGDWPIARAVRASACIPLAFQPVRHPEVNGSWHVDGGLISNFPSWVFSEQFRQEMVNHRRYLSLACRPWINIGLRITDAPVERERLEAPIPYLASIYRLARGRARTVLENAVSLRLPRALNIDQPEVRFRGQRDHTDVSGLNRRRIRLLFARGRHHARNYLRGLNFDLPTDQAALDIETRLRQLVDQARAIFGQTAHRPTDFRSSIFIHQETQHILTYQHNMDDAIDRHLRLSDGSGAVGMCYNQRSPYLTNLKIMRIIRESDDFDEIAKLHLPKSKLLELKPDRTWLASVPIFDPRDSWVARGLPKIVPDPPDPDEFNAYHKLEPTHEGAVFGVLNIDSALDYQDFNLDPDCRRSLTDPRVQSIISIMIVASQDFGRILAARFPEMKANHVSS